MTGFAYGLNELNKRLRHLRLFAFSGVWSQFLLFGASGMA